MSIGYLQHGVGALDPDNYISSNYCVECKESVYKCDCAGYDPDDWETLGNHFESDDYKYCETCGTTTNIIHDGVYMCDGCLYKI